VTVDAGYDLAYLLDLERIKRLKARYFRFLDEQNWAGWGDLFTEDARFDLQRHGQD
jgi:3-phenylpropionate/cinnamic acid dioxygenase small subunit